MATRRGTRSRVRRRRPVRDMLRLVWKLKLVVRVVVSLRGPLRGRRHRSRVHRPGRVSRRRVRKGGGGGSRTAVVRVGVRLTLVMRERRKLLEGVGLGMMVLMVEDVL